MYAVYRLLMKAATTTNVVLSPSALLSQHSTVLKYPIIILDYPPSSEKPSTDPLPFYVYPKGDYSVRTLKYNGVRMSRCTACGHGYQFGRQPNLFPKGYDCRGQCYHKKSVIGNFIAKYNTIDFQICKGCKRMFHSTQQYDYCSPRCFNIFDLNEKCEFCRREFNSHAVIRVLTKFEIVTSPSHSSASSSSSSPSSTPTRCVVERIRDGKVIPHEATVCQECLVKINARNGIICPKCKESPVKWESNGNFHCTAACQERVLYDKNFPRLPDAPKGLDD